MGIKLNLAKFEPEHKERKEKMQTTESWEKQHNAIRIQNSV